MSAFDADPRWIEMATSASRAALAEAGNWGFLAAAAALAAERTARGPIVVKVRNAPGLLAAFLADAHPSVVAVAIGADDGERLGLADGLAMACSASACARPSGDPAEIRRGIRMLMGA
jgi:hypothetical protein